MHLSGVNPQHLTLADRFQRIVERMENHAIRAETAPYTPLASEIRTSKELLNDVVTDLRTQFGDTEEAMSKFAKQMKIQEIGDIPKSGVRRIPSRLTEV